MSELEKRVIFKDQICDAKWRKSGLTCQKGTLRFSGDILQDFTLYRAWCNHCERIRIVDRKEFEKQFRSFAKNIEKELEG